MVMDINLLPKKVEASMRLFPNIPALKNIKGDFLDMVNYYK